MCPTSSLTRPTTCELSLTTLLAAAPQSGLVSLQKKSVSMRKVSEISIPASDEQGCIVPNEFFVKDYVPRNLVFCVPGHLCCPFTQILFWVLTAHSFESISYHHLILQPLCLWKGNLLFYQEWAAHLQNIKVQVSPEGWCVVINTLPWTVLGKSGALKRDRFSRIILPS